MDCVAFADCYRPDERAAQVDLPSVQLLTALMKRIHKPRNTVRGVIKDAGATPGLDNFAVTQAECRYPPEISGIRLEWPTADQKPSVRRVV